MRTFVAGELPTRVRKEIAKIQENLRRLTVSARWVEPKIVHLTLAFFGSIAPEKVEIAGNILEEVWGQVKPLELRIGQLGGFPKPSLAKIIFLSLGGETGKLTSQVKATRKHLSMAGIYFEEKLFLPHITLGRLKKPQNLAKILPKIKISQTEFLIKKIGLTESTLTRSGPIYQDLKTIILK